MKQTRGKQTFLLLQALRAIAALLVVDSHALELVQARLHRHDGFWINGAAGVDLFFVISGFVMMLSAESLRSAVRPARRFLWARLLRIAPMYWAATTLKVAILLLAPGLAAHSLHSTWHVAASYLFLPSYSDTGDPYPVLVVGWTLNLEMLFYGIFTLALWRRARVLTAVAPALIALYLAGVLWPGIGTFGRGAALLALANPLVLEFLFGVALGRLVLSGRLRLERLAPALLMLGFAALLLALPGPPAMRPFRWGLPALAIVAAALALESRLRRHVPGWLLTLGDASYSIYLVHGLVLPVLALGVMRLPVSDAVLKLIVVVAALLASALAGVLVYCYLERPVTVWVRDRFSLGSHSSSAAA